MLRYRAVTRTYLTQHANMHMPHVQDKNYGFAEFRSVEEASNAMALDGVACRDMYLKIRWVLVGRTAAALASSF